ncbi:hypothetical protein [Microbacterium sp.]|uniref:hypothetical protein n=1 Tax=Microbacterium sp. TaxID=51671 RepID=UPI0039E6FE48
MGVNDRDEPFRRLLHWYPPSWRRTHGDVVAGIMRDVAEADGRTRPSRAETRAAIVDGLAHRLDRRLAIGCAVAAIVLGAIGFAMCLVVPAIMRTTSVVLPMEGEPPTWASIIAALVTMGAPVFVVVSLVATLRGRGMRGALALSSLVLVVPAVVPLAAMTASWFTRAHGPLLSLAAWMLLAAGSAVLAAAATAILIGATLSRRWRGWGYAVGAIVGACAGYVFATTLPSPATLIVAAVGALVVAVVTTRPRGERADTAASAPTRTAAG